MTDEPTLTDAITRIKRAYRPNDPWKADDFIEDQSPPEPGKMEHAIARILNAVVSADLTPADDKDATIARWRQNSTETWQAMKAMRDAINEVVPMPSLESDLLQGPENSVFCATVAEAVVKFVQENCQCSTTQTNATGAVTNGRHGLGDGALDAEDRDATIARLTADRDDWKARYFRMRDERDKAQIVFVNYANFNHEWRQRAEQTEAKLAEVTAFVADFADAKFKRIDRRAPDPQDDLDPLTEYLPVEAWQDDARALAGEREEGE